MEKMGDRIKKLRKDRKISQDQLAEVLGISRNAISMYENNKREPTSELKEAIADFFNIDMDYLYGRTEIKNRYQNEINNNEFSTTIGERIKKARLDCGMSIDELAELAGISVNYVYAIESGRNRTFNRELMIRLAHILDVSASYFLNDNNNVNIGKNIEAIRLMSDTSIQDIAVGTNTEVSRIIKVENGAPPTVEEIERVAKFFHIPEQWIVNFDFSSVMDDERIKLAFQILAMKKEITKEEREQIISYARFIMKT